MPRFSRPHVGRGYRPIADYAIIGDGHTSALIARDGSVDWCCWPDFDSPALLCRLLDAGKGGWLQIAPSEPFTVSRAYVSGTNVLETEFATDRGRVKVTDLMPIERLTGDHRGEDIAASNDILRLVEGLGGEVELVLTFKPTFDFGRVAGNVSLFEEGAVVTAGHESLMLSSPTHLAVDGDGVVSGRLTLRAGDRAAVELAYYGEQDVKPPAPGISLETAAADLHRTLDYWRHWTAVGAYDGPYAPLVERSALTLKLLTYEPTGALVAAPTTSLPARIGGVRNWDYRYTWLRDSSLILRALLELGHREEAEDFFGWLEALCVEGRCDFQIMYSLKGRPAPVEAELPHLEGYRGSRPVRIGNAARRQAQLDIYGEVLMSAAVCYQEVRPLGHAMQALLRELVDRAERRWRERDHGMWEYRTEPRHFLHSKLLCWVALDRGIALAEQAGLPGDVTRWRRSRDEIRRTILTEGYDTRLGAFTQTFGDPALDASVLVMPIVGFLPPDDPRMRSTIERIQERLASNGLLYRYLNDDGLPAGEGAFPLCTFWLADNLALAGRTDEARAVFERIAAHANDVGLLSEEIDPDGGELLGNFPQGFTHLALVRAAALIGAAERGSDRRTQVAKASR